MGAFLDGRVLGLHALVQEHRDRDRGEDADDHDDDQQLDEREPLLALADSLHSDATPLSVTLALPDCLLGACLVLQPGRRCFPGRPTQKACATLAVAGVPQALVIFPVAVAQPAHGAL